MKNISPIPRSNSFFAASLGTNLFSAFLIYLLEITSVISFVALIFSGELASHLPEALGLVIVGNAILIATVTWFSSYAGSIGVEQDTPGAVMSIAAVAIVSMLPGAQEAQFATVVMLIVLTTTLTGALLLSLGVFKLGRLVRFLPYPMMGGFLAGTGWLLAVGGVGVMANTPLGIQWLERGVITLWLPGVALAIFVHFARRKFPQPYTFPAILLLASLTFYTFAAATHTSIAQLRTEGWLFHTFSSGSRWQFPIRPALLSQVDWGVLLQQLPTVAPAGIISVIALLLNTSGLELIVKKDIDLNRELVAAGIGNLVAGPLGGLVGYQAISLSALNHTMTGGKRQGGFLLALLVGATIFIGPSVVFYIPTFILGAVLFYMGFDLLVEWVYEAWFKFSRVDFWVIMAILIVIIVNGFLEGILVGLVLAVIMFAISYSQVSVIKFALTGQEYQSRVTRIPQERQILEAHGDQAYILKLEGFIFFGTANGIFNHIREHIQAAPSRQVKYILLDFSKVSGMDSTSMLSFSRMVQWSQEQGITLIFAGLTGSAKTQIHKEPSLKESYELKYFVDPDRGLEWCEKQIISQHMPPQQNALNLSAYFKSLLKSENSDKFLSYLQRREYQPGEYLMREGNAPDYVYFIESGLITAQLERAGKTPVRLETMSGGRTVGELGFYLGARRTASVVCEQNAIVYTLSSEDLKRMEIQDPEAASLFHRITVRLLSERVTHLTRTVGALER